MLSEEEDFDETQDCNTRNVFLDDATDEDTSSSFNHDSKSAAGFTFPRSQTFPSRSPYMKECFKPARIRRTRSHMQRIEGFMELDIAENDFEFSRKKQRNSCLDMLTDEDENTNFSFQSDMFQTPAEQQRSRSFDLFDLETENLKSVNKFNLTAQDNFDFGIKLKQSCAFGNSRNKETRISFGGMSPNKPVKMSVFCGDLIYSTPTRKECEAKMTNIEVDEQVDHIVNHLKTKIFAIDFDNTLLSIHTEGRWSRSATELAQYVRPVFKALIPALLKRGLTVAIVSFSAQLDLMARVANICFKHGVNGKNVFICGGSRGEMKTSSRKIREFGTQLPIKMFFHRKEENLCDVSHGKCPHLANVLSEVKKKKKSVQMCDILFVDDDLNNIEVCHLNLPQVKKLRFMCSYSEVDAENELLGGILNLRPRKQS